ncbi:hypothetical protein PUNSTDRAFT_138765 [Punctularia strigosozonata HHB-11173 SS5]|uniref:Uncharacterized protein n=1 Tax=Punctularia strigosozonata (strain HHB-11173) TaxID=741275 RepID=R7S3C8_PUNST|nr:uncharacterized protein PUNSTDRAFT_138765 [Punctularia strigosozonata HHB-11173 SS5]EIN04369.1 hypothetical protein PUNSTDRAFT_138765 [Punctularia strigosozonata HHB-11173 SS5]
MPACLSIDALEGIIEAAAAADRTTARTLCLVAPWTQRLAQPHLYATIATHRKGDAALFDGWLAETTQRRAPAPRSHHVRRLWLDGYGEVDPPFHQIDVRAGIPLDPTLLANLRQIFPNLQSVGWAGRRCPDRVLERIRRAACALPPSKSGGGGGDTREEPVDLALRAIPRIYAEEGGGPGERNAVVHVDAFRNLTHLAFGFVRLVDCSFFVKHSASDALAGLEMVVFEVTEEISLRDWIMLAEYVGLGVPVDGRNDGLVFVVTRWDELEDDWEREAFGGDSVWERARVFTEQMKSRGWLPPPEAYWLDSEDEGYGS